MSTLLRLHGNKPWCITPEYMGVLTDLAINHYLKGGDPGFTRERIPVGERTAFCGPPLNSSKSGYQIVNGKALLPVDGVLVKHADLMTDFSGGTSTKRILSSYQTALDDSRVDQIILVIDSPGGDVDGIEELSDFIYKTRDQKNTVAFVDGMMCSGAMWIGSTATQIYAQNKTDNIGSIGVVISHLDISRFEEKEGFKTTEVYQAKYKRLVSMFQPLDEEGRAYLEDEVQQHYDWFVDAVARNRGMRREAIIATESRIYRAEEAQQIGLIDGLMRLDEILGAPTAPENDDGDGGLPPSPSEVSSMDRTTLNTEHPDLVQEILDEGKALGAEQERNRIKGVHTQTRGHGDEFEPLLWDGETDEGGAAVAVLQSQKKKNADRLAEMQDGAPAPTGEPNEEEPDPLIQGYKQFKARAKERT